MLPETMFNLLMNVKVPTLLSKELSLSNAFFIIPLFDASSKVYISDLSPLYKKIHVPSINISVLILFYWEGLSLLAHPKCLRIYIALLRISHFINLFLN